MSAEAFTPALGRSALTFLYDPAIRLLTRERRWRRLLLDQLQPRPGERILDVGCGTGSLAIQLKAREPSAKVVGIDPDERVLKIAREKASAAGVRIVFERGFARDAASFGEDFGKVVASLVFHQVPLAEKEAGISAMVRAAGRGGEVHVADYARQHSFAARQLFRIVQWLDGRENTQANADGVLELILSGHAARSVVPEAVVATPTGAISLFRLRLR